MKHFAENLDLYFDGLVLVVVLVVIGLACSSCTPMHYTPVVVTVISPENMAETNCDQYGKPVIVINKFHSDDPFIKYALVHEGQHADDMRSFHGGCAGYLYEYNTDPMFRLRSEARARCAAMDAAKLDGMVTSVDSLVATLRTQVAPTFTLNQVERETPCFALRITGRLP